MYVGRYVHVPQYILHIHYSTAKVFLTISVLQVFNVCYAVIMNVYSLIRISVSMVNLKITKAQEFCQSSVKRITDRTVSHR